MKCRGVIAEAGPEARVLESLFAHEERLAVGDGVAGAGPDEPPAFTDPQDTGVGQVECESASHGSVSDS